MADYPLHIELAGRLCIVVGGGPIGRRKIAGLLAAGAQVRLIDPKPPAFELADRIEVVARSYRAADLSKAFLVFAATGDVELDRAIATEARRQGALVNLPGEPAAGDFTLPAVLRRGDLTVSISTAGRSPALAALLKEQLSEWLPGHWVTVLEILAAIRDKHLAEPAQSHYNRQTVDALLKAGLVELVSGGQTAAIDRLLKQTLGDGYTLKKLAIELPPKPE
jgi:precorrin-2 dehydrogenase/sirohydrochlorin ferrochelatase